MNFFTKIINFLNEVKIETKKINWPTKKEAIKYALMVVGVSAVTAIFLGGVDFIFTTLLERFILR